MRLRRPNKQECVAILEHSRHLTEQPLLQQPPEWLRHLPPDPVQPQQQRVSTTRGELPPISVPPCAPAAAQARSTAAPAGCLCWLHLSWHRRIFPTLQGNCISSSPITVVVTDTCPQCGANHLDISADAFAQVRHLKRNNCPD